MRYAPLLVLLFAACGSPVDPGAGAQGERGRALVELRQPNNPVRGVLPVELRVVEAATGRPVDGLDVGLEAVMPAHAHGASSMPHLTGRGDGTYVGEGLGLSMAGRWELHVTLTGAIEDRATLPLDVR